MSENMDNTSIENPPSEHIPTSSLNSSLSEQQIEECISISSQQPQHSRHSSHVSSGSNFLPEFTTVSISSDEFFVSPTTSTNCLSPQSQNSIPIGPFSTSHQGRSLWFQQTLSRPISLPNPTQLNPTILSHEDTQNDPNLIHKATFLEFVTRYGVPENTKSLRSLTWKLLLNYIPFDKLQWQRTLQYKRDQYHIWVKEFVVNPYSDLDRSEAELHRPIKERKSRTNNTQNKSVESCKTNLGDNLGDSSTHNKLILDTSIPNMSTSSSHPPPEPLHTPPTTSITIRNKGKVDQWVLIDPDDDPLSIMALTQSAKKGDQDDYDPYTDLTSSFKPIATYSKHTDNNNSNDQIISGKEAQEQAQRTAEKKNKWAQYYLDEEIRAEIDKDVQRTYSTLHFFQKPVHPDDQGLYDKHGLTSSPLDIDQHQQLLHSQLEAHNLLSVSSLNSSASHSKTKTQTHSKTCSTTDDTITDAIIISNIQQNNDESTLSTSNPTLIEPVKPENIPQSSQGEKKMSKKSPTNNSLFGDMFSQKNDSDDDIDPFAISGQQPTKTAVTANLNANSNSNKASNMNDRSLHDDLFLGIKSKSKVPPQGLFDNTTLGEDEVKYSDLSTLQVSVTIAKPVTSSVQHRPLCHHDVLRRLLFLYAKLNPGVRYVQGMNEILAPIYYVFASDPDYLTSNPGRSLRSRQRQDELLALGMAHSNEYKELLLQQEFSDAEADTFFVFSHLMSEIRDRYIKSLDQSEHGILSIVARFNGLLHELDFELWNHLAETGIDPRFYSFRWITLLLSQDFELPDVFRLWDSLFADSVRFVPLALQNVTPMLMIDSPVAPISPSMSSASLNSKQSNAKSSSSSQSIHRQNSSISQTQSHTSPLQSHSHNQHVSSSQSSQKSSLFKRDKSVDKEAKKKEIMDHLQPTDPHFRFELYICCAMLVNIRDELIGCDFTECLYSIHHYPEERREIDRIISIAHRLRRQHLYQLYEKSRKSGLLSRAGNSISNFIERHNHEDQNGIQNNNNNGNSNNNNNSASTSSSTSSPTSSQTTQNSQTSAPRSPQPTRNHPNANNAQQSSSNSNTQRQRTQPKKSESSVDQFINWLKR